MKDRAIAKLLWTKITAKAEVAVFFHQLRSASKMMSRADRMQQQLMAEGNSEVEKVVFKLWLNSGLNPAQAYRMMPFTVEEHYGPVVKRHFMDWKAFCTDFTQWMRYVALYRNGDMTKFDDSKVARVLTKHVKIRRS